MTTKNDIELTEITEETHFLQLVRNQVEGILFLAEVGVRPDQKKAKLSPNFLNKLDREILRAVDILWAIRCENIAVFGKDPSTAAKLHNAYSDFIDENLLISIGYKFDKERKENE